MWQFLSCIYIKVSVEGALKEQSLILVLTHILDNQAVLCEESQGSMLLE